MAGLLSFYLVLGDPAAFWSTWLVEQGSPRVRERGLQEQAATLVENQAAIDVARMVEEINQKTAGWIYGIPKNKYDAMVKKPEDLLKPLESV